MLDLWDWRRRVAHMYAAARSSADPERAWSEWRETRDELFRSHPQTPLDRPEAFQALPFFPYDPALRLHVALHPAEDRAFYAPAGDDGDMRLRPFAQTEGLEHRLGAELTVFWIEGYGGGAFLPFVDRTCGNETYGGGRYLLDTIKGADLGTDPGQLTVLDFNFAYNPSCAYSSRYICPLAPPSNRLATAVRGGEMGFPHAV